MDQPEDVLGTLARIELDLIDVAPQIRKTFHEKDTLLLAESMKASGQTEPVGVRPMPNGRYKLIKGERRVTAARDLGWTHIKAVVLDVDDERAWVEQYLENMFRVDVSPIEQAAAFKDYIEREQIDPAKLARKIGLGETTVRDRLQLLNLPLEIQHLITAGELAAAYGEQMGKLDPDQQWDAWDYLQSTPNPHLPTFREYCRHLKKKRDEARKQGLMPGLDSLFSSVGQALAGEGTDSVPAKHGKSVNIPRREDLPPMVGAPSTGIALEHYIKKLLDSEDADQVKAAEIIGTVYHELRRLNLIRTSRKSMAEIPEDGDKEATRR